MSATLWLDSARDETLELGGTVPFYQAFAAMARAAGPGYLADYPALFAVAAQVESQADAGPAWLADVRREAGLFLERHGAGLGGDSREILALLSRAGL